VKKQKMEKKIKQLNHILFGMSEQLHTAEVQIETLREDLKAEREQLELWKQRCRQIKKEYEKARRGDLQTYGGY
jgi:uncharacterized protein (DUF3084 family)